MSDYAFGQSDLQALLAERDAGSPRDAARDA